MYPNPTDGNFLIEIKSKEISPYSFEIINSVGSLIYKIEKLNDYKIKINKTGFPSGIYYIRLNDGKSVTTKKMVVQ
ncbi:MAG: T9SS type A sorting domain-containing protein [Bacteroidota bacterium]